MSISAIHGISIQSPAELAGISVGERLISINQHRILDVLDYKFYSYEEKLLLELENAGTRRKVSIEKGEGEDLGLEFETYLMDRPRSCANQCVFCFVDQMPPNMRKTLYFKDDDARLSFLTGNYITLTNLSQREIQRIIDLRISPINISVHATNPSMREKLLGHPKAGECIQVMQAFAKGKITMNCQIVACPSWNDGAELIRSLSDLAAMHPYVNSISVVPVGLTKYRENLPHLQPYQQDTASTVIEIVEDFAQKQKENCGSALAWCSDEFYLLAQKPLPPEEYYEDYTQWENGVGMLSLFRTEFSLGLTLLEPEELQVAKSFSIATGTAASVLLKELIAQVKEKQEKAGVPIEAQVYTIKNDFFGHTVTVAGLITGADLVAQLKTKSLASRLLISQSMLRHGERVFLDDMTVTEVEQALGVTVIAVPQDGNALVDAIYDLDFSQETGDSSVVMTEEAHPYNL